MKHTGYPPAFPPIQSKIVDEYQRPEVQNFYETLPGRNLSTAYKRTIKNKNIANYQGKEASKRSRKTGQNECQ